MAYDGSWSCHFGHPRWWLVQTEQTATHFTFLANDTARGQEILICDETEVEVSYECFSSSALAIGGTEAIGAGWLTAAILFAKRRHYSEQLSLPTFRDCVL